MVFLGRFYQRKAIRRRRSHVGMGEMGVFFRLSWGGARIRKPAPDFYYQRPAKRVAQGFANSGKSLSGAPAALVYNLPSK